MSEETVKPPEEFPGVDYKATPPGLTVSDDESLINWRGKNYVNQELVQQSSDQNLRIAAVQAAMNIPGRTFAGTTEFIEAANDIAAFMREGTVKAAQGG